MLGTAQKIMKSFDDDGKSFPNENVSPKNPTKHAIKTQHVLSLFPDDKSFEIC